MKQFLFILALALSITSCKKYEGNYQQVPDPVDTTSWQDGYQDGGTLPGGGTQTQNGEAVDLEDVFVHIMSGNAA
jgi:hypothetical protein